MKFQKSTCNMEVKKKSKTCEEQVGQQLLLCSCFFIHLPIHLFGHFKRTSSHPSSKNPFDLFRQTCVHTTEQSNEKSSLVNHLLLLKPQCPITVRPLHFIYCVDYLKTFKMFQNSNKGVFLHLKQALYHQTRQSLFYSFIIHQHLFICPS